MLSSSATSTLLVTSTSSYSSFYIRPTAATIRVSVATDDDATPTPMAVDVDDVDDDANEYDLTPAVSLFVDFQNRFGPYQLVPYMYLIILSWPPLRILLLKPFVVFFLSIFQLP